MKVRFGKKFKKQYRLLPASIRGKVDDRLRLFVLDPKHPILRLHPLKGKWTGYYSINISGDLRAIFKKNEELVIFTLVGTHSQLYG